MNRMDMLFVIPAILLIAILTGGCSSPAPAVSSPTPALNPSQPAVNDIQPVPEAVNPALANLSHIQAELDEIGNTLSLAEPGSINQTTLDAYQAEIEAYAAEINNISMASQQYLNQSPLTTGPGVSAPPPLSSSSDGQYDKAEWDRKYCDIANRLTALENEIRRSKPDLQKMTVIMGYMSKIDSISADIDQLQYDYSVDPAPRDPKASLSPIQYKELIGGPLMACQISQLQLRCASLHWTLGFF